MNDIEKAIEDLRGLCDRSVIESEIFKKRHEKNFDLAIEALEKQTPARIERSNTRAYGYCPECGKVFWDKWENEYCENCGQKLDWSGENE